MPREWWIVETKSSYFIYEDAETALKEMRSQSAAYGYAAIHHAKSDYDALKARVVYLEQQLSDLEIKPSDFQVIEHLTESLSAAKEREQKLVAALRIVLIESNPETLDTKARLNEMRDVARKALKANAITRGG
jgi:hypothetical protein